MLVALFAAALAVQVLFWSLLGLGFSRVRRRQRESDGPAPALPLSVVVAARDEAEHLPLLLDALERQTLPPAEVVVADDGSTDETAALVERRDAAWARTGGPPLRLVRVPKGEAEAAGLPRKKHALTRAIEAASHDRLLFTDADGVPPPTWTAAVARAAAEEEGAVLVGYGPLLPAPGLLNAYARYETLVTALMTAAAIGWDRPYMAVGRNLSYPRSLFERLGGFAHSARSLSGDDDLLVQEVDRTGAAPVRYLLDPGSFVPSAAPATLGGWLRQKRRHASAGRHYRPAVQARLLLFHASNVLVWLGAPVLWLAAGTPWGAGFLAVRFLVQRAALKPAEEAFGARDLTLAQPVLDLLYLLHNAVVAPLGVLLKPARW
ncbi:MAG: glycosyltransferase [Rubricoccaceae bacterium]|nr:glycosyltransferase [Rubricoccaceae bacterium]